VIRTRVGYAGGVKKNPTYHDLGDHTESFQIDYDPEKITYEQLLDIFWNSHSPCQKSWSVQYRSAVFYADDEQKKAALGSKAKRARLGEVLTAIEPLKEFTPAEDYHQKYMLRNDPELMKEFAAMYPDAKDFRESTAAARVNSYLSGSGTMKDFDGESASLGLSEKALQKLRSHLKRDKD
jgi:peptide-methionine (S)-S-oxide reductase